MTHERLMRHIPECMPALRLMPTRNRKPVRQIGQKPAFPHSRRSFDHDHWRWIGADPRHKRSPAQATCILPPDAGVSQRPAPDLAGKQADSS